MKLEKKTNKYYIIIFIVLMLLSFGYYKAQMNKDKLVDFSTTRGQVVEVQKRFQRGYFVRYNYKVAGKQYYNNQKLTIKKELISIGDVFEVKYSTEDESVSELNFKKKINNE